MCKVSVTLLVDQPRLNDRITGLGNSIVTAGDRVPFEDVTGAQDIKCSADPYEGPESTAAALAVREIVRPAARSSQRNRWRLFGRVTHRANLIRQFHLHGYTANFAREITNGLLRIRCVAIDINHQYWIASFANAHGGSQNLRLLHQRGSDFVLSSCHRLNPHIRLIENTRSRIAESANCNRNKSNRREKLRQTSYRLRIRKLQGNQIGLICHVTRTFQIANVKTGRLSLGETAVTAE